MMSKLSGEASAPSWGIEGADASQLIQVCYDIDNPKTKERELRSLVGAAK